MAQMMSNSSTCNERRTLKSKPVGANAPVMQMYSDRQLSKQLSSCKVLHQFGTLLHPLDKVGKTLHLLHKFDTDDILLSALLSALCTSFGTWHHTKSSGTLLQTAKAYLLKQQLECAAI